MTVGEFAQKTIDNAYFLNNEGSHFVKAASGTVNAFEVYADDVKNSQASLLTILLDEIPEEVPDVMRGDVNQDGQVNISDVTLLINHIITSQGGIDLVAADVNFDNFVNISDATILINYLLSDMWP
jgi:hypothetical protein